MRVGRSKRSRELLLLREHDCDVLGTTASTTAIATRDAVVAVCRGFDRLLFSLMLLELHSAFILFLNAFESTFFSHPFEPIIS